MSKDCILRFKRNGRVFAVASIFRDLESLQAEVIMEREVAASIASRMSGGRTYRGAALDDLSFPKIPSSLDSHRKAESSQTRSR